MKRAKLEYIWLDGDMPTQKMRSKTKIISDFSGNLEDCPIWSFDGSSTMQAEGNSSDCLLKPVNIFPDPVRENGFLVMCEVLNPDSTPHPSNGRATIDDDDEDFWFGFEQEYTLWDIDHHTPLGFPAQGYFPAPQGPYYCSVGAEYAVGREIVERHLDICINAGINIEGINAEVMKGQWEYQVGPCEGIESGDMLTASRYILKRVSEKHGTIVSFDPKPLKGDWNGAGCHTNFSTEKMRTGKNLEEAIYPAIEKLGE